MKQWRLFLKINILIPGVPTVSSLNSPKRIITSFERTRQKLCHFPRSRNHLLRRGINFVELNQGNLAQTYCPWLPLTIILFSWMHSNEVNRHANRDRRMHAIRRALYWHVVDSGFCFTVGSFALRIRKRFAAEEPSSSHFTVNTNGSRSTLGCINQTHDFRSRQTEALKVEQILKIERFELQKSTQTNTRSNRSTDYILLSVQSGMQMRNEKCECWMYFSIFVSRSPLAIVIIIMHISVLHVNSISVLVCRNQMLRHEYDKRSEHSTMATQQHNIIICWTATSSNSLKNHTQSNFYLLSFSPWICPVPDSSQPHRDSHKVFGRWFDSECACGTSTFAIRVSLALPADGLLYWFVLRFTTSFKNCNLINNFLWIVNTQHAWRTTIQQQYPRFEENQLFRLDCFRRWRRRNWNSRRCVQHLAGCGIACVHVLLTIMQSNLCSHLRRRCVSVQNNSLLF